MDTLGFAQTRERHTLVKTSTREHVNTQAEKIMTDFFFSAGITCGALFFMVLSFKFLAYLSHLLGSALNRIDFIDFDFASAQASMNNFLSLERQAEECWQLYKQGSLVESELLVNSLLSMELNPRTQVRCLHLLALILMQQNNFDAAEKHLWKALNTDGGYSDPLDEIDLRLGLARLFHEKNSTNLEMRQLERVLLLSEQFAYRFREGFEAEVLAPTLMNLGDTYLVEKRLNDAAACFKRVMAICAHQGSELLAANARLRLESLKN